ncbi:uncharacterized protein ARMOST_14357 [Armillaria ostoyae]|uniref:Uncharacterized protein n=1 Tax=Armillaria ostoyae TaxID=47428 RepID=A0A284RQD5_ARMOS|nr:uncharacterized protein ARMOST_14357 [Armillaria ostoyae]
MCALRKIFWVTVAGVAFALQTYAHRNALAGGGLPVDVLDPDAVGVQTVGSRADFGQQYEQQARDAQIVSPRDADERYISNESGTTETFIAVYSPFASPSHISETCSAFARSSSCFHTCRPSRRLLNIRLGFQSTFSTQSNNPSLATSSLTPQELCRSFIFILTSTLLDHDILAGLVNGYEAMLPRHLASPSHDLLGPVDGNRLSCRDATSVTAPPSSPRHSCDSGLASILINDHTPAMLTPLFIRASGSRLDLPIFLLSLFPVLFHFQPIIFISMNGPEHVWYYPEADVRLS